MSNDEFPSSSKPVMPEREFIFLMALLTALTALGIDIILPAMPVIADTFGLKNANDQQLLVTVFMLGFAVGNPVVGPLADRFGRVRPLLVALVLVFVVSLVAAWAPDYTWLLVARFVQGFCSAAARVIPMAIIRDRFGGREMARITSIVMSIFIIVPVLAPSLGGLIVAYSDWKLLFLAISLMALVLFVWSRARLSESLKPEDVVLLNPTALAKTMWSVAGDRLTLGYALAQASVLAVIYCYLGSAQQIFGEQYGLGTLFPLAFSSIAIGLVIASLINSRIVVRLGMRLIGRRAGFAFMLIAAGHGVLTYFAEPPLMVFIVLIAAKMFLVGLLMPNLNALAMEPHGHRAGIASAFLGFFSTSIGAVVGGLIGSLYNGTTLPMMICFCFLGVAMLTFMWIADNDRENHEVGMS